MTTTARSRSAGASRDSETAPGGTVAPSSGASRRRRPMLVWAAVVAGVLFVAAVWLVAFSPVLGVRTVTVRGTRALSAAQVRDAAAVKHGTALIRLDAAAVARRVEQLPEVASASVHVSYPSTVVITVVERSAVGYLPRGSGYVLVDRTGDQFRTVGVRPKGVALFDIPAGATATATGRAVADVAAALPTSIRQRLASIQALDPTSITLQLTDSRVVRWGSDERNADKARILPALLSQPGTQFDITDPDQVTAR